MTLATVTSLPSRKPSPKATKPQSRRATRQQYRQRMAAVGLGAVAATLTGLSLSHLAHGIELISHGPAWEGWATAIGVDLGFVSLELSQIATNDKGRAKVSHWVKPTVIGLLTASALMNAFAFASGASNYITMAAGAAWGVAIPLLVYALTRIGATLYLDANK